MKILITGSNGFMGRYLVEHLLKRHPKESIATLGREKTSNQDLTYYQCDLTEKENVRNLISKINPDRVFHLAGIAKVSEDIGIPDYYSNNVINTSHLLDALGELKKEVALLFTSTVHVYGNQNDLINETAALKPETPYGFSKYLAELTVMKKITEYPNIKAVIARMYTCIGPKQSTGFAVSDFCHKINKLIQTGEDTISVGPTEGIRSFVDVRDAVQCFPLLLEKQTPNKLEIFNLSSSNTLSIQNILEKLIQISGHPFKIVKSNTQNNSFKGIQVDNRKLLNFLPEIKFRSIEESLKDMLTSKQ